MAAPQALQHYADRLKDTKFKDIEKLWISLQAVNKGMADACAKEPPRGQQNQKVMNAVTAAYDKMRKDSSNRGRSKLSKTASPSVLAPAGSILKGVGWSAPKGEPLLSEMELVDEDVFMVDNKPAELLEFTDINDLDKDSTGVAFLSATKTAVHLDRLKKKTMTTKLPCCIVCKKQAFDAASTKEKAELKQSYKPITVTLHFKEKKGPPKPVACLVFQIGATAVFVRDTDQDEVITINSDRPQLIKMSVSLINHANKKDFDKLKENFSNEAVSAIGAKLLPEGGTVKYARTKTDYQFLKSTVHMHQGYTLINKESYEAVMRRSGRNGYIIQESFRNDVFTVLRLKEEPNLENALRVAKLLDEHAFGVVATAGGFAVRVKTADKDLAYCLYNETLSNICGVDLIGRAKADSMFYQIHGVPIRMSDIELAKVLTLPRIGQASWTCHPETRIGPPRQGCKTILVKAAEAPPKGVVKVRFNDDMILLQISEHQQKHRDLTIMQKAEKIVEKIEKKELGSYAAALGAKPKAKPCTAKPSIFAMNEPAKQTAWSEADVDEDREKEAMELDHIIADLDETAGDFSDEESAAASAVKVTKNRFGLPVATPKKSQLQIRLEQMDRDREEAMERAARDKEEHMAAIAAVQESNEGAISELLGRMETLQATMIANQEENNAKFKEMQTKGQAQFAQMLAFFQKFEANQQKPAHGKGSSKSAAAQEHSRDELEEDGPPKKLKVPFGSPCLTNASASADSGC
jgi:hypothetical protein